MTYRNGSHNLVARLREMCGDRDYEVGLTVAELLTEAADEIERLCLIEAETRKVLDFERREIERLRGERGKALARAGAATLEIERLRGEIDSSLLLLESDDEPSPRPDLG